MLSYYLNNSLFFSNINVELRRKVINIFMSVIFLTIHSILKYYNISVKELEWIYCGDGICSIMLNHEIDKKNQVITCDFCGRFLYAAEEKEEEEEE